MDDNKKKQVIENVFNTKNLDAFVYKTKRTENNSTIFYLTLKRGTDINTVLGLTDKLKEALSTDNIGFIINENNLGVEITD